MPIPTALLAAAGITAVVSNAAAVYYILANDRERETDDIPLCMTMTSRRRSHSDASMSHGDRNGDRDNYSIPSLVRSSATFGESVEMVDATTIRRRTVAAPPIVDDTIHEEPSIRRRRDQNEPVTAITAVCDADREEFSHFPMVQSSTAAREPENHVTNSTLRRRHVTIVPVNDNKTLAEESLEIQISTTDEESYANLDPLRRRPVISVPIAHHTRKDRSLAFEVQCSTTAREADEAISSVPIIGGTTCEELLLEAQSSTMAREPTSNKDADSESATTTHRRPGDNNHLRCDSKRRSPPIPAQKKKLHIEPAVAVTGLSLHVVPEWKTTVTQDSLRCDEGYQRKDQAQLMGLVEDSRPFLAASAVHSSRPTDYISDELNQYTLGQASTPPWDFMPDFSVPLLPPFTESGKTEDDVTVVTSPSQLSSLFTTTDPFNSVCFSSPATQDAGPSSASISSSRKSTKTSSVAYLESLTHSLKIDTSSEISSISQVSEPSSASKVPPQLPPLPTFTPLCVPFLTNEPTSPISTPSPSELSDTPSPLTTCTPRPHCVRPPGPHKTAAVASSDIYNKQFTSPGVMSSVLSELDFISE